MSSTVLSQSGRAVDVVAAMPVAEAEANHQTTAATLTAARAARDRLNVAHGAVDAQLTTLRTERAAAIAAGVKKLLSMATGDCPESSTLLAREIKSVTETEARTAIASAALVELVSELMPDSEAAVLIAEAAHLDAAGEVVEARRWARMREFNESLSKLADSEGEVELRSARFDADGRIRDEHRAAAMLKRRELELKRAQWQQLRAALKG